MKSFSLHRLPSEEILRILLWCDDGSSMQAVSNLLADKLPYPLFRINTLLLIDVTTIKGTTSYSWTRVQKTGVHTFGDSHPIVSGYIIAHNLCLRLFLSVYLCRLSSFGVSFPS